MPKTTPYIVSLDIGSSKVCALIAETGSEGRVDVVGKGIATHKGTRKGAIIDVPATVEAIKRATEEAEIMAGVQIERAVVGVSGPVVRSFNSRQVVAVAARSREISREDIGRALDAARSCPIPSDYEILAVLQRQFVVDGQDGVADPLGMVGSRLEADVHVVTVPVATTQNLLKCVNGAGVSVTEMVLEPLAASEAVLTVDEKDHGVVLADIGGGTTEIAVWHQGALAHTAVIPIGGDLFTNDLAVLLKTPVPDAERLKKKFGAAYTPLVTGDETVDVPRTGGQGVHPVPRGHIAEILEARARELFEVLWREATTDVPARELRAGLVLTGGGAALDGMADTAEHVLGAGVPVRIGVPRGLSGLTDIVNGPEWACAAGLLLVGRGGAAAPKGRPAPSGGLFSKLKNSLGRMFSPGVCHLKDLEEEMILFEDEVSAAPAITIGEDVIAPAHIKVVGVGGGGGNAVNRMIQAGIRGVEFIAANTDLQVLRVNRAAQKIQLGLATSRGMGAGSNPDVGRTAALEDAERIAESLAGSDMVFVTAGMGGGTGTGAAPVVAKIASEAGALVVAIVSKPFAFEGRRKLRFAEDGIAELREYVDTLITIPNERLYAFVDRNITAWEAFKIADDVLRQAVQGISDLITVPGYVNVDFADVKTVMENMGMALMGTGMSTGEHRAVEAAQKAISNPLLEEQSIQGARAILINVTGGEDLTLAEFNEACQIVQQAADDDANIIFGLVQDAAMHEQVKVSVIATGFDAPVAARRVAVQAAERTRLPVAEETLPDDSGFGVNLVNVRNPKDDIFDIPTFLRRQMD